MKTLVLGGTRSGKSRLAEQLATDTGFSVTYIATATAGDGEMGERIALHQQRRPNNWALCEEPVRLSQALITHAKPNHCLLVDCLTLWLTNLLMQNDEVLNKEKSALLDCLSRLPGCIIFVSNETNMGITPMGELSRRYVDEAGLLHQQIAAESEQVILTVAGLPHYLKGQPK